MEGRPFLEVGQYPNNRTNPRCVCNFGFERREHATATDRLGRLAPFVEEGGEFLRGGEKMFTIIASEQTQTADREPPLQTRLCLLRLGVAAVIWQ